MKMMDEMKWNFLLLLEDLVKKCCEDVSVVMKLMFLSKEECVKVVIVCCEVEVVV